MNPLYSEKLQLKALRPLELPRDDEGAQPVAAGRCGSAVQANGKGRGDGTVMFTTPSSWEEAGRPVTYGPPGRNQQNGSQSQREMPREPVMGPGPQTMGAVKQPDQQERSGTDELQLTSRLLQLQPRPGQLCVEDLWGMVLGPLSVLQKDGQVGPLDPLEDVNMCLL